MTEFLVKRGGPKAVVVQVKTDKGKATITLPVRPHGQGGRVSIPDAHVAGVDPRHAKFLVALKGSAAPELAAAEEPTRPDLPASVGKRVEKVAG